MPYYNRDPKRDELLKPEMLGSSCDLVTSGDTYGLHVVSRVGGSWD